MGPSQVGAGPVGAVPFTRSQTIHNVAHHRCLCVRSFIAAPLSPQGTGVYVAHTRYSNEHGDMFPRQAGFLPERSTLHNLFVVQHVAHHALSLNRLMYVVFLDVPAAYDTTDHAKMVDTLINLQFPEHLVRGIAGMYQGLRYQVVTSGRVASPFHVGVGVKQGCPLSPMLYNLYVQPLSAALSALDKGPRFPGLPGCHPDYHYADDAALVAECLPDLQALLNHTAVVLADRNLKLSVPKCIALVLGVKAGAPAPADYSLSLGTANVASASLTEGTRYLGLIFDSAASAGTMAAHRVKCFSSSFHAATAQMRAALDFPCALPAFLKLLHTVMEPTGLYGSELWGLLSIPGLWSSNWSLPKFYGLADPLEVQRCRLIRQGLRLPASVPHLPLLHELGSEPLVHCYVRRAVRFYNCLVDLDVASVYRGVLRQNIDDALLTRSRAHNFVGALFQVLRILLPRVRITRTLRNCLPLDATAIDEALSTRYTQHIQHLSQVEHGTGSRIGLYFRVVGTHALGVVPSFYSCRLSHGVLVRFLRFRLGCHHLRIHTGRWQLPALLRPQRTCLRCSSTAVDDEAHCLFLCEHPTIVEARDVFLSVVVPPVSALSSLRYADFWALYSTGRVPLPVLVKYVATCVRVGRQCHQSGGTDVVDLPDILLPEDQYLDMFDSESDISGDNSEDELVEAL